ncbi:carbohydrate ABC transporter permease [Jiangella ureilytica]|uniref:Carbohydrate ABC transporter permease n=1 Tax=Jiangella ureilytica TaxID=2530374 RepID=A0A4R4RQU6_9ACTN|nr:carbohydrate ABC transporter permease [Jiangella ureilytica]TDC51102.1 carbohydrate ABC transporter permease [Jiangella ureilytica]
MAVPTLTGPPADGRLTPSPPGKPRRGGWTALRYVGLIGAALVFVGPFVWIWISSLRTSADIGRDPFGLPTELNWDNYVNAFVTGRFGAYLGNTFLYVAFVVPLVLLLASMAAYALTLVRTRITGLLFVLILLGVMVPFQSIMIPQYYVVRDLGLLGSYWGIIVPSLALGLPFGIFLMRAFFLTLPAELRDAARVDGASELRVFWHVMLPLARPGILSLAVFQFMFTWNAFLIPLLYGQHENLRPVASGIMFFVGEYNTDRAAIAAAVTLTCLPVIITYLFLQRYFIAGMTAGALK